MSDGMDRKWINQIFCFKLCQKFLTKNDQTNNKSSSNFLCEENGAHKTYNDTLVKNYLVQKSCAIYPMENVERKQITK